MDRTGIDISVLSFPSPYLWFPGIDQGRRLARSCNDYSAGLVSGGRGRFGHFAGLPALDDTAGCLREIEYGLDALRAQGVAVMTSYGDKWLGDSAFAPVWDELDRRSAVVFVHPAIPGCCGSLSTGVPAPFAEMPFDTARAVASLWHSGALARWPRIRFVLSHGGGALPMIANRMSRFGRTDPVAGNKLHDGDAAFAKLYFDTANAAAPAALAAVRALADPRHILFGSDYPYVPLGRGRDDLAAAGLTVHERRAIERDNALSLMPDLVSVR